MSELVVAALVAAVASVIIALLERARRDNGKDHALTMDLIRMVGKKVDRVDGKLDRHVEWHVTKDDTRQ